MIFSKFTKKKVSKGTILQHAGDKHLKNYVVVKGLLRSYIIDSKGKEHIFMFGPEDWIVGDIYAAYQEKETQLFIDALEDSELIIPDQKLEDLTRDEMQIGISKLLNRVGVLQNRILLQMSSSALERYEHFLTLYPELQERIPQKMIASYLGITPEALSSIRSKRLRKK